MTSLTGPASGHTSSRTGATDPEPTTATQRATRSHNSPHTAASKCSPGMVVVDGRAGLAAMSAAALELGMRHVVITVHPLATVGSRPPRDNPCDVLFGAVSLRGTMADSTDSDRDGQQPQYLGVIIA